MNFDFILECETSDEKRKKQYEEIYRLIDEAEHIYWVDKSGCAELLCKAAEQICFAYNDRYEVGFGPDTKLENFLCYSGGEADNVMVSRFLSVVRKEQRDRLNKLRVLGEDCSLDEAAPDKGMTLEERMEQNVRRMMETMMIVAADMCNRLENKETLKLGKLEFSEEVLPVAKPQPPKKKFWQRIFQKPRQ